MASDAAMSAGFPSQRHASVTITLTDGRRLTNAVAFRRGDPEWPLSDDELNTKFDDLAAPVIGVEKATALRGLVWRLDTLSVADLNLS